ncbi:MAG: TIGR00269 family protein [Euryarchaeota archaeon]|nr:TIGR00269 family protein [Euryarchaeota archaeon]
MAPEVPMCSHCRAPAVEQVRYAGVHLCKAHFVDFVERRVKKELRKQGGVPTGATVGVAVSGGKDSTVALRLLHRVLLPRLGPECGGSNLKADARLVVLTIDEGIDGYRGTGIDVARRTSAELGVPHHILGYTELVGATMDQVHTVKGTKNECSYCGVFRRASLNQLARDTGCDLLVTGHNLDDIAQAVLMNVTGGDVARLARLGPHKDVKEGLVPRRMPLRTIPEKEIYLTAMLSDWETDHAECPYAVNSQRALYRDILNRMEKATPGTRHALLQSLDTLRPVLGQLDNGGGRPIRVCDDCGEPSAGAVCKVCELGEEVRGRLEADETPITGRGRPTPTARP